MWTDSSKGEERKVIGDQSRRCGYRCGSGYGGPDPQGVPLTGNAPWGQRQLRPFASNAAHLTWPQHDRPPTPRMGVGSSGITEGGSASAKKNARTSKKTAVDLSTKCPLQDSNLRVRTQYDLNVPPWTARANGRDKSMTVLSSQQNWRGLVSAGPQWPNSIEPGIRRAKKKAQWISKFQA